MYVNEYFKKMKVLIVFRAIFGLLVHMLLMVEAQASCQANYNGVLFPCDIIQRWRDQRENYYKLERAFVIKRGHPSEHYSSLKLFWPEDAPPYSNRDRITFYKCINRTPTIAKTLMHIIRGGMGTPELVVDVMYAPVRYRLMNRVIITCHIYTARNESLRRRPEEPWNQFDIERYNDQVKPVGNQSTLVNSTFGTTAVSLGTTNFTQATATLPLQRMSQNATWETTTWKATTVEATTLHTTTLEAPAQKAATPKGTTLKATTPKTTTVEATRLQTTTLEETAQKTATPKATTLEATTPKVTTLEAITLQATTFKATTLQETKLRATTVNTTTLQVTTPEATTLEATSKKTEQPTEGSNELDLKNKGSTKQISGQKKLSQNYTTTSRTDGEELRGKWTTNEKKETTTQESNKKFLAVEEIRQEVTNVSSHTLGTTKANGERSLEARNMNSVTTLGVPTSSGTVKVTSERRVSSPKIDNTDSKTEANCSKSDKTMCGGTNSGTTETTSTNKYSQGEIMNETTLSVTKTSPKPKATAVEVTSRRTVGVTSQMSESTPVTNTVKEVRIILCGEMNLTPNGTEDSKNDRTNKISSSEVKSTSTKSIQLTTKKIVTQKSDGENLVFMDGRKSSKPDDNSRNHPATSALYNLVAKTAKRKFGLAKISYQ